MLSIIEYVISYFSKPKRSIMITTENLLDTTIEHLIKLELFPNSRDFDHWKGEIVNNLMRTQKPKIKNNIKIKQKRFFEILFSEPVDPKEPYFDSYLWFSIRDLLYVNEYQKEYSPYRDKVHKVNEKLCDLLYDKIKKFMWEISKYMSDRVLSRELIKRELEIYLNNEGELNNVK